MKGLDTNLLVRYVTRDDPAQAERARRLLAECESDGIRLFVSDVVLCELVWVLTAAYGYPRADVARALERFLHRAMFMVSNHCAGWNKPRSGDSS